MSDESEIWFSDDVDFILNEVLDEDVILGRGFAIYDGSEMKGLSNDEEEPVSDKVKKSLCQSFSSGGSTVWLKCFPGEFTSEDMEERPILVFVGTETDGGYEVEGFSVFSLYIIYTNGPFGLNARSGVKRMEFIPDIVYKEFFKLTKGRYVPSDFDLVGKPMPKDKSKFHSNPPYSISCNSAWRTAYWHMQIDVDKNDIIKSVEFTSYKNENTMFARPTLLDTDPAEYVDCLNYICDQYSKEEWKKINQK